MDHQIIQSMMMVSCNTCLYVIFRFIVYVSGWFHQLTKSLLVLCTSRQVLPPNFFDPASGEFIDSPQQRMRARASINFGNVSVCRFCVVLISIKFTDTPFFSL